LNDLSQERLITPSSFSETHSKKRSAVIIPSLGTLSVTIYGTLVEYSLMIDSFKKHCSTLELNSDINKKFKIFNKNMKKIIIFEEKSEL
jgi:hypothetical protein